MANYEMTREALQRNIERFRAANDGDWIWPFDITLYENRESDLSVAERESLDLLIRHFEMRQRKSSSQMIIAAINGDTPLTRLICPLCDLLDVAGAYASNRFMALRILLQEIHRRQQTYWGWSREIWITLLCSDSRIFHQYHHATSGVRPYILVASYLLSDCVDFRPLSHINLISLAQVIFGETSVQASTQRVAAVPRQWGERPSSHFPQLMAQILLAAHSPRLQDVHREVLLSLSTTSIASHYQPELVQISRVLTHLRIIKEPIERPSSRPQLRRSQGQPSLRMTLPSDVPSEWALLCQRWREDAGTTLTPATRRTYYHYLLKIGRWLQQTHPHAGNPSQWTPSLASECVRMVNTMRVGE